MLPEGAANMSGSTAAAIVIPIIAFILLFAWIGAVFWADSHPRWGNSEPGQWTTRTAVLPEGSSIPRPRVEGEGAPQQQAPQGQAGATSRS
jgi:hypothetical protein